MTFWNLLVFSVTMQLILRDSSQDFDGDHLSALNPSNHSDLVCSIRRMYVRRESIPYVYVCSCAQINMRDQEGMNRYIMGLFN